MVESKSEGGSIATHLFALGVVATYLGKDGN